MPLFVFECEACHAETEILIRGGAIPECPSCGSTKLVKQASAFAALSGGASRRAEMPMGCGAASCCQLQGGGCGMN